MKSLLTTIPCTGKVLEFIVTSPIGDIKISSCQAGLHAVHPCGKDDSTFSADVGHPVLLKTGKQDGSITDCRPANECYMWLKDYFMHKVASTDVPSLCSSVVKKDSFCAKALQQLPEAAPIGKTISYKDLARLCGNEQASRAAGHAMATNPMALLIPCHRVITSAGTPGNYAHGKKNNTKVWLLKFRAGSASEVGVTCTDHQHLFLQYSFTDLFLLNLFFFFFDKHNLDHQITVFLR
ncbi:unnamed protein product [Candidula unifasciata]|uniref:Methylated-DNA--protein-cysteine methyltransferase n=1 Tax=Candidula unifasciata TaxID=100452 RepID=A0A8S3ZBK7_9EUPU|nr:unnamed protein product [Candidula unifasciata]